MTCVLCLWNYWPVYAGSRLLLGSTVPVTSPSVSSCSWITCLMSLAMLLLLVVVGLRPPSLRLPRTASALILRSTRILRLGSISIRRLSRNQPIVSCSVGNWHSTAWMEWYLSVSHPFMASSRTCVLARMELLLRSPVAFLVLTIPGISPRR